MIIIQPDIFDISSAYKYLSADNTIGAVNIFIGKVRDFNAGGKILSMELEHYPQMAQKCLNDIALQAKKQFAIQNTIIIHRYGKLDVGEPIVLCGAASAHRQDAISAVEMMMDYLKTQAPFWKLESSETKANWVESQQKDNESLTKWQKS